MAGGPGCTAPRTLAAGAELQRPPGAQWGPAGGAEGAVAPAVGRAPAHCRPDEGLGTASHAFRAVKWWQLQRSRMGQSRVHLGSQLHEGTGVQAGGRASCSGRPHHARLHPAVRLRPHADPPRERARSQSRRLALEGRPLSCCRPTARDHLGRQDSRLCDTAGVCLQEHEERDVQRCEGAPAQRSRASSTLRISAQWLMHAMPCLAPEETGVAATPGATTLRPQCDRL